MNNVILSILLGSQSIETASNLGNNFKDDDPKNSDSPVYNPSDSSFNIIKPKPQYPTTPSLPTASESLHAIKDNSLNAYEPPHKSPMIYKKTSFSALKKLSKKTSSSFQKISTFITSLPTQSTLHEQEKGESEYFEPLNHIKDSVANVSPPIPSVLLYNNYNNIKIEPPIYIEFTKELLDFAYSLGRIFNIPNSEVENSLDSLFIKGISRDVSRKWETCNNRSSHIHILNAALYE